jgi:hypothetical protein
LVASSMCWRISSSRSLSSRLPRQFIATPVGHPFFLE